MYYLQYPKSKIESVICEAADVLFTVPLDENQKFDSEGAHYPSRKSKSEILWEEMFYLRYPSVEENQMCIL